MSKKSLFTLAVVVSLCACVALMLQWRYDHMPQADGNTVLIRTNRFTGNSQKLSKNGWVNLEYDTLVREPCTPQEMASDNPYTTMFCSPTQNPPPPR